MRKIRHSTKSPIYQFWVLLHAIEIGDSELEKSARRNLLKHGIRVNADPEISEMGGSSD